MSKQAWVLRLKEKISSEELDGKPYYLCDDEATDFLTDSIQDAEIIWDKEQRIRGMKEYDQYFIDEFGEDAIRNFGWENISKNFDFIEVEVD